MELSTACYLALLAGVGTGRLLELRVSRRNQRRLLAQGARKIQEPYFVWMVAVHAGVLTGSGLEVVLLRRPWVPVLAIVAGMLLVASNLLRWWVIRTLGGHWNVQVVASSGLGVVTSGPYRWIRHPNYVAVFVELIALPLLHTAWLTAAAGSVAHAWVLRKRIRTEEAVLLSDPAYVRAMGSKPRFFPTSFSPQRHQDTKNH